MDEYLKELVDRLRNRPPNVLKDRDAASAVESLSRALDEARQAVEEQRLRIAALMVGMHDETTPVVRRIGALEVERDEARAEAELLRADAARYQWLRDEATGCNLHHDLPNCRGWQFGGASADAAIDAARGAKP